MENETQDSIEKRRAHIALMGRMTAFGGWVLAFASLFLGSYLLNKFHLEIVELQRKNTELKSHLSEALSRSKSASEKKAKKAADAARPAVKK